MSFPTVGSLITSVGVVGSSSTSAVVSYGVAGSTANSSSLSAVVSYGTAGSTANSTSLSAVVSAGVVGSSGLSATVSYGLAGSTANSSSLSAVVSAGLVGSSGLSATQSYGTAGSTANSSSLSAVVSYGTAGSTANSTSLSAVVSAGVVGSSGLSATVSYGLAGSTANSSSLSAVVSTGVAIGAVGKPIGKAGSIADTAITNNTQVAGNRLALAAGDVLIEEVYFAKDTTGLTGPTNVEVSCDNVYGKTGVDSPLMLKALASFGANLDFAGSSAGGTAFAPFVLESGKGLFVHGDNAAGGSAGALRYAVKATALSAGGSIS